MVKQAVAIDLGASYVRVAVGDSKGNIIFKLKEETSKGKELISDQIIRMVKPLLGAYKSVSCIGIGVVGPLDLKKKSIVNSPNIKFKNISLIKLKKLGKPIFMINDAKAAVLGEKYYGLGKNSTNLVYITLSTGIGAGAIVDNNLLIGDCGNAVEIGHSNIDSKYNLLCTCKKGSGHWESLASGANIPRFFKKWLGSKKVNFNTTLQIFDKARKGNKIAKKFLDELGKVNARAISNVIVAYNPELIILGGSVTTYNKNLILPPIIKNIDDFLKVPKIKITKFGDDVVLKGGLVAAFHRVGTKV